MDEKQYMIIRRDRKFLKYIQRSKYEAVCHRKYCIVETIPDFFEWCKEIGLPENMKIPRIPISQSLAIILGMKLAEKGFTLASTRHLIREGSLELYITTTSPARDWLRRCLEDNYLHSTIEKVELLNGRRSVEIDILHSLITINDTNGGSLKYIVIEAVEEALKHFIY